MIMIAHDVMVAIGNTLIIPYLQVWFSDDGDVVDDVVEVVAGKVSVVVA